MLREYLLTTFWMCFRTFFQVLGGLIGTTAVGLTDVDWIGSLSAAALGAVICLIMRLGSVPSRDESYRGDSTEEFDPHGDSGL